MQWAGASWRPTSSQTRSYLRTSGASQYQSEWLWAPAAASMLAFLPQQPVHTCTCTRLVVVMQASLQLFLPALAKLQLLVVAKCFIHATSQRTRFGAIAAAHLVQ